MLDIIYRITTMPFRSHKSHRDVDFPEVALDEESSYGSGTEASLPPPPPPPISQDRTFGLFRSARATQPPTEIHRDAIVLEDDDDESVETMDASYWPSYWNQWFPSAANGRPRRLRAVLITTCLLMVALLYTL